MIKATIIADSISAHTNQRITTFELEYPRFILAEVNTHRTLSRNTASSRAIPIDRMIELVEQNTAKPIHWGSNKSGMQAGDEIEHTFSANNAWLNARNDAIKHAKRLQSLGLHKQIVNRVLEPFQTVKTLVTATSFDNFFNLRCHKDAQPEIKHLADLMYEAMQNSVPELLRAGEWHTPYVHHERDTSSMHTGELLYYVLNYAGNKKYLTKEEAIKVSCSCAAQVSYRKNDASIEKALAIYDKLVNSDPVHASAFEHCATPIYNERQYGVTGFFERPTYLEKIPLSGNFQNWIQYRHLIEGNTCYNYTPIKEINNALK